MGSQLSLPPPPKPQKRWKDGTSKLKLIFFVYLKKLLLTWTEISPGFECFGKSNYYSGRRERISSLYYEITLLPHNTLNDQYLFPVYGLGNKFTATFTQILNPSVDQYVSLIDIIYFRVEAARPVYSISFADFLHRTVGGFLHFDARISIQLT